MIFDIDDCENLIDSKRGIVWGKYNRHDSAVFSSLNKEVKKWSSQEAVKKYISGEFDLDSYLISFVGDDNCEECLFYAFVDGKLCGVVLISPPSNCSDDSCIQYLIVNPALQGKGIGTAMIASIFENGKFFTNNLHKGRFVGLVHEDNIASRKACIKSGFVVSPNKNGKYIKFTIRCNGREEMSDD